MWFLLLMLNWWVSSIGIYHILKYIMKWVRSVVADYKQLNELDDIIGDENGS